jgi:hypothetical protein
VGESAISSASFELNEGRNVKNASLISSDGSRVALHIIRTD